MAVTSALQICEVGAAGGAVAPRTVIKRNGETSIEGLGLGGDFKQDEDD